MVDPVGRSDGKWSGLRVGKRRSVSDSATPRKCRLRCLTSFAGLTEHKDPFGPPWSSRTVYGPWIWSPRRFPVIPSRKLRRYGHRPKHNFGCHHVNCVVDQHFGLCGCGTGCRHLDPIDIRPSLPTSTHKIYSEMSGKAIGIDLGTTYS